MEDWNAPVKKGDIADLDQKLERFRVETDEKFAQLGSEINHGYNDIAERIHDGQAAHVKAFYSNAWQPVAIGVAT